MRRGQAALEYLLTYGWAILIVIIVGVALYNLGVFNPGTWTGKRTTGFSQFQIVDFKWATDENVTLVVGNRLGKTITLESINMTYKGSQCNYAIPSADQSFGPNIQKVFVIPCTSGSWANPSLKASYTIDVDFHYKDPDSGLTHIDSGTLFGAVE